MREVIHHVRDDQERRLITLPCGQPETIRRAPAGYSRSETIDSDDGIGEGFGCLLRYILTDRQSLVRVLARELSVISRREIYAWGRTYLSYYPRDACR